MEGNGLKRGGARMGMGLKIGALILGGAGTEMGWDKRRRMEEGRNLRLDAADDFLSNDKRAFLGTSEEWGADLEWGAGV
jgi:hypothetical protein